MKNSIKSIAAAIALSLLTTNAAMATNKSTDTTDFVVNGIILKSNKKDDAKCKLELFHENNLIESSQIKMNKPFERKLKRNVWYTIRVTKEGYMPLMISFNTALDNEATILDNIFEFETALIDVESAKHMDQDLVEFPVGHVAYNKDNQKFEARDMYTSNYMATLYKTEPETPTDVVMVYKQNAPTLVDIAKENITKNQLGKSMC